MVCSAAFDRDDEFFATAGVSKRIKASIVCRHTSASLQDNRAIILLKLFSAMTEQD